MPGRIWTPYPGIAKSAGKLTKWNMSMERPAGAVDVSRASTKPWRAWWWWKSGGAILRRGRGGDFTRIEAELRPGGFGGDPTAMPGGPHWHLDPRPWSLSARRALLVTDPLPSPTDYQILLLHHVCQDGCHEIVNETLKDFVEMTRDDTGCPGCQAL